MAAKQQNANIAASVKRRSAPIDSAFSKAVRNIAAHGDTDVLPFPLENFLFTDCQSEVIEILEATHKDFDKAVETSAPYYERLLAPSGYNGFRWVTQIDPRWNAYYLSLAIQLFPEIERRRLSTEEKSVFSYRYHWDKENGDIFSRDIGYDAFTVRATELAQKYSHVALCDIAQFYDSSYHHKIENALRQATSNTTAVERLNAMLFKFSGGYSYGLPVGGNASRILAEALLVRVDKLLATSGIPFCRFVDDYRLFANSADEAFRALVQLSQSLGDTEMLRLQKSKCAIVPCGEYLKSEGMVQHGTHLTVPDPQTREFLSLRLHFDPYSSTAEDDYEKLKEELGRFDIVGILARELSKSRVQLTVVKRLMSALRYMSQDARVKGVESILQSVSQLAPVFPYVAMMMRRLQDDLGMEVYGRFANAWRSICRESVFVTSLPANLAFTIRSLAADPAFDTEKLLVDMFRTTSSSLLRREIIYAMYKRKADHWIASLRSSYASYGPWEKRALFVVSDILGDEGEHWRKNVASDADDVSRLLLKWLRGNRHSKQNWELPI